MHHLRMLLNMLAHVHLLRCLLKVGLLELSLMVSEGCLLLRSLHLHMLLRDHLLLKVRAHR